MINKFNVYLTTTQHCICSRNDSVISETLFVSVKITKR